MTLGKLLDNSTPLFIFYFYSNDDPRDPENAYIRGVFGKYVDKSNKKRIKYTRQMKFCINKYQLLNIKDDQ